MRSNKIAISVVLKIALVSLLLIIAIGTVVVKVSSRWIHESKARKVSYQFNEQVLTWVLPRSDVVLSTGYVTIQVEGRTKHLYGQVMVEEY
jgi:hypothetical protein